MSESNYDRGLQVRREMLGREFVDRQIAEADDFTRPLQDLVTEFCWGAVWARPGLSRKIRSMLNIAMLTALNRPDDLRYYVKVAVKNGVTRDEIMEILVQTVAYCGFPAAFPAWDAAKEALESGD